MYKEPGLGARARVVTASCAFVLAACVSGRGGSSPTIRPTAGEQAIPALQSMKVTLIPKVREVRALNKVSFEAPAEGLVMRPDAPYNVRVSAWGTGNLGGETWLEKDGEVVGKTSLGYDRARDEYIGDIRLIGGTVPAGDYEVRASLESTDIVNAAAPLHVRLESPLDPALKAQIEDFRAYFDTDAYNLRDADFRAIQSMVAKIQPLSASIRSIQVEGHCDTRGIEDHNTELGANRAAAVAKAIQDLLPGFEIGVVSLGSDDPDPDGQNPTDWAKNRWARIRIEYR